MASLNYFAAAASAFALLVVSAPAMSQTGQPQVPAGSPFTATQTPGQQVPTKAVGKVTSIQGPTGSVLVLRGNQVYSLANEDLILPGDQVFTRTNGSATLTYHSCTVTLDAASTITVSPDCSIKPAVLSQSASVGGVQVAATGAGGVGGVPLLIGTIVAAGGVVAAANESSSP